LNVEKMESLLVGECAPPPKLGKQTAGCHAVAGRWIRAALHYACTGEAESGLLQQFVSSPGLLACVNRNGDSLIGIALLMRKPETAQLLVDLTARYFAGVLDHRSVAKETLLMLALSHDGPAHREVIRQLVLRDPEQVYTRYDAYGKNAFHHCAEDAGLEALQVLLDSLTEATMATNGGFRLRPLHRAFRMPDRFGWTPVHYLVRRDRADMLQLMQQFCSNSSVWLELRVRARELGGRRQTPLELATDLGCQQAREFLLASDQVRDQLEWDADESQNATAVQLLQ
ncbi:hypothetical protein BOX15_Mlig014481g2, partial [Macrostomum lignano]